MGRKSVFSWIGPLPFARLLFWAFAIPFCRRRQRGSGPRWRCEGGLVEYNPRVGESPRHDGTQPAAVASFMMTDPLLWSPINLGRWAGTQVRIHITLIAYVVIGLLLA